MNKLDRILSPFKIETDQGILQNSIYIILRSLSVLESLANICVSLHKSFF